MVPGVRNVSAGALTSLNDRGRFPTFYRRRRLAMINTGLSQTETTVSKQPITRVVGMAATTQRTLLTVVVLSLITLAAGSAAAQTEFTYFGNKGPASWGRLDPAWTACGQGHQQSPINLGKSFHSATLHRQPVPVEYGEAKGRIFNNGHTIEIEAEGHNVLNLGGVACELQQFHFHGPSEHTVDGKGSEMELHFVHKSAAGGTAVVGVLLVHERRAWP